MNKKNGSIELFSTISPEELTHRLLEIGVSQKHINNHLVKYFYIIDKIYTNDIINKNAEVCRLSTKLLKNLLGSKYSFLILKNLKESGIILLSSKYFAGVHSNGYILSEPRGAKLYTFSDSRFVSKIIEERVSRIEKDTKTLSRLFRTLRNLQLDHIDMKFLSEDEFRFVKMLQDNPFQTVGKKGKRVYNNFCNLPKSIRSKVKLNGEYLGFVDIVNSQMIFLSGVISDQLRNKGVNPIDSTAEFISLSINGRLYEKLMKLARIDSRMEIKELIFEIIFSKKSYSKLKRIFKKEYSQVYQVINDLKADDYKVLAHLMQQKEAKVVFRALDSIEFNKDVLTIHDSLYCPKSEINTIKEALIDSFKTEGLNATINVNDQELITVNSYTTNEIEKIINTENTRFDIKLQELKAKRAKNEKIGVKGLCELAQTIDFDHLDEVTIKQKLEEVIPVPVIVNMNQMKFNVLDYFSFGMGCTWIKGHQMMKLLS
jgi:hypothetical protein